MNGGGKSLTPDKKKVRQTRGNSYESAASHGKTASLLMAEDDGPAAAVLEKMELTPPSSPSPSGYNTDTVEEIIAEANKMDQERLMNTNNNNTATSDTSGTDPVVRTVRFESPLLTRSFEEMTPEEKIDKLKEQIQVFKVELHNEKQARRRKEKNLVKLAKELQKRTLETAQKEERMLQMAETIAEMEKQVQEQQREVLASHQKYNFLRRTSDSQMDMVLSEHEDTTSKLRKNLLEANLEMDRLRARLAKYEMQENPEEANQIKERTLREARNIGIGHVPTAASSLGSRTGQFDVSIWQWVSKMVRKLSIWSWVTLLVLMVGVSSAQSWNTAEIFSRESVCAPTFPGRVLTSTISRKGIKNKNKLNQDLVMDAPWWTPIAKDALFRMICGKDVVQTRLVWNNNDRLVAYSLNNIVKGNNYFWKSKSVEKQLWSKNSVGSARIGATEIILKNSKGGVKDTIRAPWINSSSSQSSPTASTPSSSPQASSMDSSPWSSASSSGAS